MLHNIKLLKNLQKKSIVFLISDFIDQGFDNHIKRLSQKHDLIPIIVNDPWEKKLPSSKMLLFEDQETGKTIQLNTTKNTCDTYHNISISQHAALHRLFNSSKCKAIHVFTQEDYVLALRQYFKFRKTHGHA